MWAPPFRCSKRSGQYDTTYGSDEYTKFLEGMGAGLDHHYAHNRHHPEHFTDGINGMTLLDVIEMLADWRAAIERHADGSMDRSLTIQTERFKISDQLAQIIHNTVNHLGWLDADRVDPADALFD